MKRLLTLIVAVSIALAASSAFAVINGTPHDFTDATQYGMCGMCHVPHAASSSTAARLWRVNAAAANAGAADANAGAAWATSRVGRLCGDCHNGGAMSTFGNAVGTHPNGNSNLPFAASSHKRSVATLKGAAAPGQGITNLLSGTAQAGLDALGYPYLNQANMQCTSCHNPHKDRKSTDTNLRPFLQAPPATELANISEFCAGCHSDRLNDFTNGGGLGILNTTGNHPVNVPYADSATGGSLAINLLTVPNPLMTYSVADDTKWNLGGKFQLASPVAAPASNVKTGSVVVASDEVGCQTCHAVHNPDPAGNANFLLAVNNTGSGGYSALCEGCHGGPTNAIHLDPRNNHVGLNGSDHPIDTKFTGSPDVTRWTAVASTTAPIAQERGAANARWPRPATNIIMCTSCHSAHRADGTGVIATPANKGKLTRLGNNNNGAGSAWAVTPENWCLSCHESASPLGHHSNTSNAGWAAFDCNGCHAAGVAGTNGEAHNGFSFYTLTGDNTSLCISCHTASTLDGDPYVGVGGVGSGFTHLGATVGGATTHYLGTFTLSKNYIYPKLGDWTLNGSQNVRSHTVAAWGIGAWSIPSYSKYGAKANIYGAGDVNGIYVSDPLGSGTSRNVICESCHSVLGNIGTFKYPMTATSGWENNLLLGDYQDDSDGTGGARAIGSGFCVACHNSGNAGQSSTYKLGTADGIPDDVAIQSYSIAPGGSVAGQKYGMHPMTNWSITRAMDAGRGANAFGKNAGLINGGLTYADQPAAIAQSGGGAIGGTASYPGTDMMDCDSCHRPHNAPPLGTFSMTLAHGSNNPVAVILEVQGAPNEPSALCQTCHNY